MFYVIQFNLQFNLVIQQILPISQECNSLLKYLCIKYEV